VKIIAVDPTHVSDKRYFQTGGGWRTEAELKLRVRNEESDKAEHLDGLKTVISRARKGSVQLLEGLD